jgi:hypothetical protein
VWWVSVTTANHIHALHLYCLLYSSSLLQNVHHYCCFNAMCCLVGRRRRRWLAVRVCGRHSICACAPPRRPCTRSRPAPCRRTVPRLQAMNSNYFLWIILAISVLAVLSKLTGAI